MAPGPTLQVRVARKAVEALDICSFELVPLDGRRLPAFSAGSHVDVHLPNGMIRQYSLCNDATESHRYVIGVLRDAASRGGSAALHERVEEGCELTISPPRNHFALSQTAHRSLLFAGGIGITPILSMAEHLARLGASFQLHYCTRSQARTAFLERLRASDLTDQVRFWFDDGPTGQRLDLDTELARPASGVHLYVCGPKGFIDAVLDTARRHAWPEDQLHAEFFKAELSGSVPDDGFEVQLARSGRVVRVGKDQTIAQALDAAGCPVVTSCEQGVCGTCLTGVLEGEPDHRDIFLTPEEHARNDQLLPCCSRSRTPRLVLDL